MGGGGVGGGGGGGMSYQNRSPMQPQMQQQSMNFGSTPHLGQQQQQQLYQSNNFGGGGGPGFTLRSAPTNREYPPNQYVDEQGRYVQQQQGMNVQHAFGNSRENSPYQVHRTNSYNPMMGNNGNNGNNNNGGYADNYGMGGDTGYQSSGPLPIQLHKNFLSRENLNQSVYLNNNTSSNNDASYSSQSQLSQAQPPPSNQFYLHDQNAGNGSPPVAPQRRTWAQSAAQKQGSENSWSSPQNNSGKGGFMLHQNGGDSDSFLNNSGNLFPVHTSSPQHNRVHRQISQMIDESTRVAEQQLAAANRVSA